MNKQKQFKMDVDDLIKYSAGTPAEAAALDVHCDRAKITFGDLETKVEHKMCLLAWCGFQDRLEFAQYLIEMGAGTPPSLHSVILDFCSDNIIVLGYFVCNIQFAIYIHVHSSNICTCMCSIDLNFCILSPQTCMTLYKYLYPCPQALPLVSIHVHYTLTFVMDAKVIIIYTYAGRGEPGDEASMYLYIHIHVYTYYLQLCHIQHHVYLCLPSPSDLQT